MIKKWELLSSELAYENPFVSVLTETLKRSDGRIIENYYSIKRRDAVYVVALTRDYKIPLVYQYKNGVKDVIWELPAGFVEANESPLESARRELLEETGFAAEEYMLLGSFVPNPSLSGNKNFVFLSKNAKKISEQQLDVNEEIKVQLFALEELVEAIKKRQSQFVGCQDQLNLLLASEELNK